MLSDPFKEGKGSGGSPSERKMTGYRVWRADLPVSTGLLRVRSADALDKVVGQAPCSSPCSS